jgi:hypothetical protein
MAACSVIELKVLKAIRHGHNTRHAIARFVFELGPDDKRTTRMFVEVEVALGQLQERGWVKVEPDHKVWRVALGYLRGAR